MFALYQLHCLLITCHLLLGASSMEVKTDAGSNDITPWSHDCMFGYSLQSDVSCSFS